MENMRNTNAKLGEVLRFLAVRDETGRVRPEREAGGRGSRATQAA